MLLRHGAIWTPDLSTLDATRRILYKLEPDLLVELLGQLQARETGEGALRKLLRVRQLRQFVAFCERRLERFRGHGSADQQLARSDHATPARMLTKNDRWRVYDAVRSKPIAKVARRYSMPAVHLLRACKELEVPTPLRGYWARRRRANPCHAAHGSRLSGVVAIAARPRQRGPLWMAFTAIVTPVGPLPETVAFCVQHLSLGGPSLPIPGGSQLNSRHMGRGTKRGTAMQLAIGPLGNWPVIAVPPSTIVHGRLARPENSHIWRHLRLCRRLRRPALSAGRAARRRAEWGRRGA